MKIRPMSLGSKVAFISSLGVTALLIAQLGFIVGLERMARDHHELGLVQDNLFHFFFAMMIVCMIGWIPWGPSHDYKAYDRWEEPDLRALFAGAHCWIAGLTAIATTVAQLYLVSTDLNEFTAPIGAMIWFCIRLYVAYEAHKLFGFRALSDEKRQAVQYAEMQVRSY